MSSIDNFSVGNMCHTFYDAPLQRVVDLEEAKGLADSASKEHIRPIGGSRVVAFEASLKDCFGLKVLYNYFNVPYLEAKVCLFVVFLSLNLVEMTHWYFPVYFVQLDLLNSLMQEMRKDLTTVREELNCYIENLDYQSHLEWRNLTKGQQTSQQKDSFADVMEDYEKTQRQNQEQERRQVSRGESRNSQASSPSQDDNNKQQRQYSATCGFKVSHDEQNESRTQPKSKDKKTSKKNKEKNSKSSEGTKKKNKKSKTKKKESSEESKESESQKQMHGETTKQDYSTNNDALDIAPPKPALGSSLDDFFSSEEDEGKESPIAIRKPGEGASVYSCGDDLSPSRDARKNQNNETNSEKSSDTEGDEDTDGVDLPPTKPDYASDSSDEVTPRRENQHRSKVDSVDNAPIPSKLQQKSPEPKHNLSAAQPSVLETQEDSVPSSVPEDHAGDLVSSVDMSTENTQAIHAMFSASDDDDDEYSSTQNNEGRDDDMAARSTSEYKNSYTDDVYSANKSTGINNVESLEWPAAEVSETKVSKVEHQYRPDRTEADEVNDTKGEVPTTHSESDDVAADRVHSSGHAEDGDDDSTQQETTELPSNQLSSDRDDFVDDDFAPPIPSSVNNMDSFLDSEEDEADEPSGFEAQVKSSSAADDDEFNFKPTVPAATGVGENLDDFLGDEEEEDYTPSLGNPSKDSVKSYERAVATNIGTSTKTSSSISSSAVAKALEDAKAQWENEEKDSKKSKKKSKKGKKNKKNKSEDKE